MKQVYDFAVKWCDKFCSQDTDQKDLLDASFAKECELLGFQIDCGYSFSRKYGKVFDNYKELHKIIYNVKDIDVLGNALYSKWYSFACLENEPEKVTIFKHRAWFSLALCRLMLLTQDNDELYYRRLKNMRIIHEKRNFAENPYSTGEIRQCITLGNLGDIEFTTYTSAKHGGGYDPSVNQKFAITSKAKNKIFNAVSHYCFKNHIDTDKPNTDKATVEFTNSVGKTYTYTLYSNDYFYGLRNIILSEVKIDNLFLSSENPNLIIIKALTIHYSRMPNTNNPALDYFERLVLNRDSGTVEYTRKAGLKSEVSYKFKNINRVKRLFTQFDDKTLFTDRISGNNYGENRYTITVDYERQPSRTITGCFDRDGLPEDFIPFAETIREFMSRNCIGDMFNPSLYMRTKHSATKYIFCGVTFAGGRKIYYYITDDETLRPGDYVLVPTGEDDYPTFAQIASIKSYAPENVPFPVKYTKRIIRRCTPFKY